VDHSIILLMGVSGSGKTTVGALLAGQLGWPYAEADAFHPAANIEKMAAGHPLTDADRAPWLAAIGRWIDLEVAAGRPAVVTCSALKRAYRLLFQGGGGRRAALARARAAFARVPEVARLVDFVAASQRGVCR